MNILDIILLICFIPALIQGIRKGFIAQAISIISIIVGIWTSARFADILGGWIGKYITASEQILKIAAFAIILVAVILALAALGKLLEGMFRLVMLGWLNKLLGVVFELYAVLYLCYEKIKSHLIKIARLFGRVILRLLPRSKKRTSDGRKGLNIELFFLFLGCIIRTFLAVEANYS